MFTLNCSGRIIVIESPVVMGILNCTPDSFYEESRVRNTDDVLFHADQMITGGAFILDIGGQSTRPGSEQAGVEEELRRVIPAIEAVAREFPQQLISVDTFYARVAELALQAGAGIVNDISAGMIDERLTEVVAKHGAPYVLMHMKGHPRTMQINPEYDNVTLEVFDSLAVKLRELHAFGIRDIILDPGFGFGKSIHHNFRLLKDLSLFTHFQKPLMVGLSRKSTVYKTLDISPAEALNGTTVLHTIALLNGALILRAHDVSEAMQAIRLVNEYSQP